MHRGIFCSFTMHWLPLGSEALHRVLQMHARSARESVPLESLTRWRKNPMQLTVRAVSKLFKVPEKTVYRWIEQDDLPASLIDGHYGFNRGELVEWATAHRISVPDELFKGTDNMVAA